MLVKARSMQIETDNLITIKERMKKNSFGFELGFVGIYHHMQTGKYWYIDCHYNTIEYTGVNEIRRVRVLDLYNVLNGEEWGEQDYDSKVAEECVSGSLATIQERIVPMHDTHLSDLFRGMWKDANGYIRKSGDYAVIKWAPDDYYDAEGMGNDRKDVEWSIRQTMKSALESRYGARNEYYFADFVRQAEHMHAKISDCVVSELEMKKLKECAIEQRILIGFRSQSGIVSMETHLAYLDDDKQIIESILRRPI